MRPLVRQPQGSKKPAPVPRRRSGFHPCRASQAFGSGAMPGFGAGFVRGVFIVVVGALILKTGYDAFLR